MSWGLLSLVSIWTKKEYMINAPEITFFKYVYKKYSLFTIIHSEQKFNTKPDFGKKITCNIDKNGDMLSKIYLVIELPSIPKFVDNNFTYNKNFLALWWLNNEHINKISWVEYIGYNIIKYIELEMNWQKIDKISGELLYIKNTLHCKNSKQNLLNVMSGNINELTTLSNGKLGYIVYIPLSFWFCNNYDHSFPLLCSKNADVKIHVEFNAINDILIYGPTHYIYVKQWTCIFKLNEIIYQKQDNKIIYAKFIAFDDYNKILFYIKLYDEDTFISPNSDDDMQILYYIKNSIDEYIIPQNNSIENKYLNDNSFTNIKNLSIINSYLLVDFIMLDEEEKKFYLNKEHKYIIEVHKDEEYMINNNSYNLPLNINNICKQIYIVPKLNKIVNGF